MAVSAMTTQAKILKVDNTRGRVSIEADIPALGQYPTRFIRWIGAGNAPAIGAEVLAAMEPTTRQARFLKDGTFTGEVIDGAEMPWQVNWQMSGAKPLEGGNGAGAGNTTAPAQTSRSGAAGASGGAIMDAGLRHRVDTQTLNDREAVRQAVAFGSSQGGNILADIDAVLEMAEKIAGWWNGRFLSRLAGDSPLVAHAESLGAVVTDVAPVVADVAPDVAPEAAPPSEPEVKNEAELRAWVERQGWSREAVLGTIQSLGSDSAREYLAVGGHTAQGLASILAERLA